VCAEFDADNFDRVTAKVQDWVASQSTGMQGDPFTRRWNAQSRTCRHTKLATADLKVSSSSWRVGASQTALKLVNWVWELGPCPQRGRKG
jgi:hypothetical protein